MGAFLLTRDTNEVNLQKSKTILTRKGFQGPTEYRLGDWKLLLYPKMTHKQPQAFWTGKEGVFVIGTFLYRGMNFEQSRRALFEDASRGNIDTSQMLGHYTVLVYIRGELTLISDPLDTKHIFTSSGYSIFSSSLMATAAVLSERPSINREAFLEKCLTGIILSPDTIFRDVIQLNRAIRDNATAKGVPIHFLQGKVSRETPHYHKYGRKASAEKQAGTLTDYLGKWKNALGEQHVDLGLSAGYDSTLLFAAALPVFGAALHIHTHSTGHVHDHEKAAAIHMCQMENMECHVVPTKRFDEMGGNPLPILFENLYFFDGRTSFDIGGFSPTYCPGYRTQATDGCFLTMTGVGGEIFRNNFSVTRKRVRFESFLRDCVFNPHYLAAVDSQTVLKQTIDYHLKKAEALLGAKLRGKVDAIWLRRYYGEVMMPEGQGHVIDAYNTVSYCIAPYLEPSILQESYKGLPYLGSFGEYESEIIRALSSDLAHTISSYGYPFDAVPAKIRLKQWIRARIPGHVWMKLAALKGGGIGDTAYFSRVATHCPELKAAAVQLEKEFPDMDIQEMMKGPSMTANLSYIALLSYMNIEGELE